MQLLNLALEIRITKNEEEMFQIIVSKTTQSMSKTKRYKRVVGKYICDNLQKLTDQG